MMQSAFDKSNEIAAAWVGIEPMLALKKRGDRVTYAEIKIAGGGIDPRRMAQKVRRYFIAQGIDPVPIVNEGWALPSHEEQVRERAEHHRGRARRETRKEMYAAASVDDSQLSPDARRLRDLHIRHASAALQGQRDMTGERKTVLGAPPPRPRLEPVK